jgi:hypothetical protein
MSDPARLGGASTVERVRSLAAPVVCALACGIGLVCTLGVVSVLTQLISLRLVSDRFIGWLGLCALAVLGGSALALQAGRAVGSGPALAFGAAAAVVGIELGHGVTDAGQLALAAAVLGTAGGLLLAGALAVSIDVSRPWGRLGAAAATATVMAGIPVQAWAALRRTRGLDLAVHLPAWMLLPACALVLAWGVADLVAFRAYEADRLAGWQEASWSLGVGQVMLALLVMLLGFDSQIRLYWLRPVILVGSALAIVLWVLVSMSLPEPVAKISLLGACYPAAAAPGILALPVYVSWVAHGLPSVGFVACSALGGLVGIAAAWLSPRHAVTGGLLAMAVGSAALWGPIGNQAATIAGVAVLVAASAAAAVGGVLASLASPAALRLVVGAFVCSLVVGVMLTLPLVWAVAGDLPLGYDDARAGTRVLLGLAFSSATVLAAYTSVLGRRIDRRQASAGRAAVERLTRSTDSAVSVD